MVTGIAGVAAPPATPRPPAAASLATPQELPDEPANVPSANHHAVQAACAEPLGRLAEELALCRKYYEATFPNQPVQRLIFIGGEAHQRSLCQQIARQLGVAAQVGDPLSRMARIEEPAEGELDRRTPQPAWAVAVGLSMGPAAPPVN